MADLGIRRDGDGYVVEMITWTRIASFVERTDAELFVRARLGGPADKPIRPTVVCDVSPTDLALLPLPPSVPELLQTDEASAKAETELEVEDLEPEAEVAPACEPDPALAGEPSADLVAPPSDTAPADTQPAQPGPKRRAAATRAKADETSPAEPAKPTVDRGGWTEAELSRAFARLEAKTASCAEIAREVGKDVRQLTGKWMARKKQLAAGKVACMTCFRLFDSEGPHDRLCPSCGTKSDADGTSGGVVA